MNLSTLTPSEIDKLWIDAAAPGNALRYRRNELLEKAGKYERAGGAHYAAQAASYREQADELSRRIADADVALEPFRAEWAARGGWSRAYIVPDGHIHRSTACSSLHVTTIVSWLPELSGGTEDEIVAFAGSVACTICYPSAPVEALRAAERAAKAAAECPGSRSYGYVAGSFRQTSYTGSGRAVCGSCGERVAVTTSGKIKAHKRSERAAA